MPGTKGMRDSFKSPRISRAPIWLVAAAALLGASAGLFVNAYWLRELLHLGNEELLLLSVGVGALATAGYFRLLRWLGGRLRAMGPAKVARLALLSIPLGLFLFFGGTSQWLKSDQYLTMFLPRHALQVSVLPSADANQTELIWFTTSLGDVSYDTIATQGWQRQGDRLVLQDPSANALLWVGQTGANVQMIFSGSKTNSTLQLAWDGHPETINLTRAKTSYERTFAVPFYASSAMLIMLGLLNFVVLSLALLLVMAGGDKHWREAAESTVAAERSSFRASDAVALVVVICLALLLRAFNLGNVFPAVDEYYHLIAAQQLVQGAALNAVYQRGLWLVTLPVALALRMFGHQLWAARLMGVVFNALALIPLYLLTRKINRPVAILSCVLYATSPWIITFARIAREYAYYPFYFYWIIYGMVVLVEMVPRGFVVVRDWRAVVRPGPLLLGAALLIPPVFALRIDWLSTFRTVLIAYLVFGIFILGRFNWADRLNSPVLAILGGGLILAAVSWYGEQSTKMLVFPTLNPIPLGYFLPNPQQQWYFDRLGIVAALGVVAALGLCVALRDKSFVPLFFVVLFASYLTVFSFLSKTFFHTRHLLTTQLWYVVVAATGLYAVWGILRGLVPRMGTAGAVLAAAVLGLSALNAPQILLPTVSRNPDMPISEDYLHDVSQVQDYMLGHAQPTDVLISTVYGLYATWEERPQFAAQYRITSQTPLADILSIVEENQSGWLVFDRIRLDLSTISARDVTGTHQIEYIGLFGDEYVWRWQRTPAQELGPGVTE